MEKDKELIITKNWSQDQKVFSQAEKAEEFFGGFKKALEMKPQEVIEEVKKSGLRGRGGAGFPTGQKWEIAAQINSTEKFFICNLDESEPGTWKDRTIAEQDPFRLIEGILIASWAIGASTAYIYLNGNFKQAEVVLKRARKILLEKGFLGENILGTGFGLDLKIFVGAGAYICGEESALINSIEGRRGEPRRKPPFTCSCGLWGKPTVVNNAETVASIAWIIKNGGARFSSLGHPDFPGTKLFCIDGQVRFPGLYEVPTGVSVRELIFDVAGGMAEGSDFRLAQIGGSSGRIVPFALLDEVPGYGENFEIPMGSGAVLVLDSSFDVKQLLLSWIDFFQRESCGKCVPCREGTFRLKLILERLVKNDLAGDDLEDIAKLIYVLERTTFCPLGKFSVVAIKDVIKYKMIPELAEVELLG